MITSVNGYLEAIEAHVERYWTRQNLSSLKSPDGSKFPNRSDFPRIISTRWFRGQSKHYPLLPKVYRAKYYEQAMLLQVLREASVMPEAPSESNLPQWYFLLQHHGFPTRLIDWSESSLVALFFAIENWAEYRSQKRQMRPIVWILNPYSFNWVMAKSSIIPGTLEGEAVNDGTGRTVGSSALEYIQQAWSGSTKIRSPLAIASTYVHPRMQVQSSRFTVHGRARRDMQRYFEDKNLMKKGFAAKFNIDAKSAPKMMKELTKLGISRGMVFPGLDSLCAQFDEMYRQ